MKQIQFNEHDEAVEKALKSYKHVWERFAEYDKTKEGRVRDAIARKRTMSRWWILTREILPPPVTEILTATLSPACEEGCCGAFYMLDTGMLQTSGKWVIGGRMQHHAPEYWMFLPDPPEVEDD